MSKIKHWNEATQSWVIDGASNAANIELTNPGYLDENGNSISVDLGFTKIQNRMFQAEKNIAWIYLNGAKGGGGGGGGGGTIDSTAYSISIEEGSRVYTSSNSITVHITITGGSIKKNFSVVVQDENGSSKGMYTVTSLTRTEIKINNLNNSVNRLTINANSGLNYATPVILTVIAGAIKLTLTNIPNSVIYPSSLVGNTIITINNSTDSPLTTVVKCNDGWEYNFEVSLAKELQITIDKVSEHIDSVKNQIGETFSFEIYALGVLNDNVLQSNSITFDCTIASPNTLYIITYGVNKDIPNNNVELGNLNKFVYGSSIQFSYLLTYSLASYSSYTVDYTITPCYFEDGLLVSDTGREVQGRINDIVRKGIIQLFTFNTASLPDDTIYDTENNSYKFVKVTLHAESTSSSSIQDTKVLYFTLALPIAKYITATNLNSSLFAYFSPVMGIPTGNITKLVYDNKNTRFTYSQYGVVLQRYINLQGHNLSGFMQQSDMQGIHLLGKSYVDLEINIFSENANEINLLDGNGWTLSFTYRTDSNVDSTDVVASLGKYDNNLNLVAGIEILAEQITYAVQGNITSIRTTKGDLTTVDLVGQRYVGPNDTESQPNHWFIKTYINGVLTHITSHMQSLLFDSDKNGRDGWYFLDFMHIGGRVLNEEVYDACAVHVYDIKAYSTALSDNEVILNYISSTIYSELLPNVNPDMSTQSEMLQKNFIEIGVDGAYHNLLFDENDETQYKDPLTLLTSLIGALAESRITYPIVVINQLVADSSFLGITESLFGEDLKREVMSSRFAINMDYYTVGNTVPTRIENNATDGMCISILGTSSLGYNSKNYEIYMGRDEGNHDVLVQMKEDWLPENRYTLKSDVMDSSHVNNILIGSIVNGLVTTLDEYGNTVKIVPMDNTPPMSKSDYRYANKVKHTSEGYPCILFINFKLKGNINICRCMGIYNFNLGRYAWYNLGLKLLTDITYATDLETYPRMVASHTDSNVVYEESPVYSVEVLENSNVTMFDLDDPAIVDSPDFFEGTILNTSGDLDTSFRPELKKLLTFLSYFGTNVETDRKVYRQNEWLTLKYGQVESEWKLIDDYYPNIDRANYVTSTLALHMDWNSMVSYYMIAIIFGLVDSMAKNLTLRSWSKSSSGDNIWYMCFYDMDTALRLNNIGGETVPYNAHIHRYYTDTTGIAEERVSNHCSTMEGFKLEYAGHNTRLQEIVENCIVDSDDVKTLKTFYNELRTNLFPDPEKFIDDYYIGQLNKVGAALYNYDYYLKYLLVKKSFTPATGLYGENTYNYSEISYLHGNGSASVKDWFVKRIRFLDGIYGLGQNSINALSVNNTPLAVSWSGNNATHIVNVSPTSVVLTLSAESQIKIGIGASGATKLFWVDETPRDYRIVNVGSTLRVFIYGNTYLTSLGKFNQFTWVTINNIDFPLIKELSLRDLSNISSSTFLTSASNLESLVKLDLHGTKLVENNNIIYKALSIAETLPNLEELDVSDSSFNSIPLSRSSVLKKLNLSNTRITSLNYEDLAMLEELNISGCNELTNIRLVNCPKLKSLTIPASVVHVEIHDCPGITAIYADYTGSQLYISNLKELLIDNCPGLKYISLNNQNNLELEVNLSGAQNLENIQLVKILTTNIIFPKKSNWNTLKELNLSGSNITYINYFDTLPLVTDYLDLEHFNDLQSIILSENRGIQGVKCANIEDHPIELTSGCFSGCSGIKFLYGNFKIIGTRVFLDCSSLKLNETSTYSENGMLRYPVPYVSGRNVCNIQFGSYLSSTDELFNGCYSLSGSDFTMLMLQLHSNISSLNKMFLNCRGIDAEINYDLFRHCPNVTNITSFAEGTSICGGIYSRSSDYSESDTTTYGTFDFLPNLLLASNAFSNTSLLYIDNNVFAPLNGEYKDIREADYMFANCFDLESCQQVNRSNIITDGYLHSKTFFTNLRKLGTFPKGIFSGCEKIKMLIDSEEINGIVFDYLFHWPTSINIRTLDNSIYQGINLYGTIHDNVFGGRLENDGEYYIAKFTVINAPFLDSGSNILCNLSSMGRMFENLLDTLLQAKYVLRGLTFTNSLIPSNLFRGCTKLNNLQGFFSNPNLTNEGNIYEFPSLELFEDCYSLTNISYLFDGCYNLDIKLLGRGFINCSLTDVTGMLHNSGVFGMIPYQMFYMENNGVVLLTIESISSVFSGCYRLGYTRDRKLDVGTIYERNKIEFVTTWMDAVIKVKGQRIVNDSNPEKCASFQLDFTNFDGNDPWYIDGRDWKDINPDLENSPYYTLLYNTVFKYDNLLKEALTVQLLMDRQYREVGYLNYMFPADYLRYCNSNCTMEGAFNGLSYYTNVLVTNDEGINYLNPGPRDGLIGRLPCKLFEANVANTKFDSVFSGLDFCAFINFNSYGMNNLGYSKSLCRGIKYPPDLLSHNINLTLIPGLFLSTFIETGVDINSDLLSNNTNLTNISALFRDVIFNSRDFVSDSVSADNSLIDFGMFRECTQLQNVSRLFEVSSAMDYDRGLRKIESILFDPVGNGPALNPHINNVQGMFTNNRNLTGSIPIFDVSKFTLITNASSYVEGVNKGSISNASQFISAHDSSWIPQSWIENNG